MNQAPLETSLLAMLEDHRGVRGCALVETGSGLVWHRRPDHDMEGIWEASVDYWRLHGRLSPHFAALGQLGAIVTYHRLGTLALIPCLREPELLLVCLADHGKVDWVRWQQDARRLGTAIRAAL